jgi:TRAF3-interacting protein 1
MSEKMDNINPAIIKKTQDTLGRLIQAPSLTDKLLNRPPVQFIQDIVKSVSFWYS